jgi:tetratricopeptide (TPR) repeat protein
VELWRAARLHAAGQVEAAARAARPLLDRAARTDSWRARAAFYVAEGCRFAGNYDEAANLYRESQRGEPHGPLAPAACAALGMCLLAQGQSAAALDELTSAPPSPPRALQLALLTALADSSLRERRYADASRAYHQVIEHFAGPEHADWRAHACYGLGVVLELQGETGQAIAYYRAAAAAAPASPWALADRQKAMRRLRFLAASRLWRP